MQGGSSGCNLLVSRGVFCPVLVLIRVIHRFTLKRSKMSYCPKFKGVLVSRNSDNKKIAVVASCKSWYCPRCAKQNRARWSAVLLDHINKSECKTWSWFTLTAHEKSHEASGEYSLKNIARMWDRLIKRMRRRYGKFEYCRVYERHQSGAYHLHCITGFHWDDLVDRNENFPDREKMMDSPWLRSNARNLGVGYKTHADNIKSEKSGVVAFYVTKYMVKMDEKLKNSWGRVRRIQTSRGIKYNNLEKSEYVWSLKSGLYLNDVDLIHNESYYLINEGRLLDLDDFEKHHVWPPDEPVDRK